MPRLGHPARGNTRPTMPRHDLDLGHGIAVHLGLQQTAHGQISEVQTHLPIPASAVAPAHYALDGLRHRQLLGKCLRRAGALPLHPAKGNDSLWNPHMGRPWPKAASFSGPGRVFFAPSGCERGVHWGPGAKKTRPGPGKRGLPSAMASPYGDSQGNHSLELGAGAEPLPAGGIPATRLQTPVVDAQGREGGAVEEGFDVEDHGLVRGGEQGGEVGGGRAWRRRRVQR